MSAAGQHSFALLAQGNHNLLWRSVGWALVHLLLCSPTRLVGAKGTAKAWGFPARLPTMSMHYIMDGAAPLPVYSAAVVVGQLGACWTMSKVVGCTDGTMSFAQVFGLTFYVPPPPSAGAVVLTALQILAGYQQPISSFSGGTGLQRVVEALKHAFALRLRLGDPGTCGGRALAGTPAGNAAHCFLDLKSLLDNLLSPDFAASLRCVYGPQMFLNYACASCTRLIPPG